MSKTFKNKWVRLLAPVLVMWLILGILKLIPEKFNSTGDQILWEVILFLGILLLNLGWLHQSIGLKTTVRFHQLLWINWYGIIRFLGVALAIYILVVRGRFDDSWNLFILATFVGITEEFIFRGLVLPLAIKAFKGKYRLGFGVVVSSVLFGVAHIFNLSHQSLFTTLEQVLAATALGALFAVVYLRTGSLWFVIITHALQDLQGFLSPNRLVQPSIPVIDLLIFVTVLFVSAALMLRKSKVKTINFAQFGLSLTC